MLALIKELIAAQLVVEETAEQFAFRHALTRQSVYRSLLGRERQILHRTIGMEIERIYAETLHSTSSTKCRRRRVAELAYHFYEAGEWQKALVYAWLAGEKAQALDAPHAAVEQFTRALTSAQHLAQAEPALTSLYRLRGLAYETVGKFEQAHTDLTLPWNWPGLPPTAM